MSSLPSNEDQIQLRQIKAFVDYLKEVQALPEGTEEWSVSVDGFMPPAADDGTDKADAET